MDTLRSIYSIYYPIFDPHLKYGNLYWGQSTNAIKRLTILQKKALKLMNFKPRNFHTSSSYLSYGNLDWGQSANAIKRLTILKKKTLKLNNFKPRNFHTSSLYLSLNILKLSDKIFLENFLLINKAINNFLPSLFND